MKTRAYTLSPTKQRNASIYPPPAEPASATDAERAAMAARIDIAYDAAGRAAEDALRFQKPKQPYPLPPKCTEPSCANFQGPTTMPTDTYWLCPPCTATAPNAYELGYARRPQDYYSNAKPWGPAKRIEWTRSFNASVLLTHIRMPP